MNERDRQQLVQLLKARFDANTNRHEGHQWKTVLAALEASPDKLRSIHEMEESGGEPDVVALDAPASACCFVDCSPESPAGRRSICYDREARESRKKHTPASSAVEMATAMGVELLTETEYRELQRFGAFDTKTSSWVATPADIRERGGSLFCDRRYDTVFVYHNGADSYYAARGFRGVVRIQDG